jgi:transcriptional regulator with XRE-family HTH domain
MAKVNFTKELAEKIKELRITNKVKAIDLAEHIKKSPAYITKLENGDIKTLDYDELLTIFNFISKNEGDMGKIIDKLSLEVDSKELEEQTWFMNFDTVERKIPIPSSLVDYINKKISDSGFTISYVVDYVNKNEDLIDIISEYNIDINKFKSNLWHTEYVEGKAVSFIIMKLSLNQIMSILEKKQDISNYVTIQSILYNLLRLEHGLDNPLSEEENINIKKEVITILNSYKFYSSTEKSRVLETAATKQEFDSLLSEFDITNQKLINEFLGYISFLSDFNIKYTNEKMILFNRNFKWDASYILTLASLPFYELENISKSLKSSLLDDVRELIEKYKNKPEAEKTIEVY